MLKEEEIKEVVDGYNKVLNDSKIKVGLVYNADATIVSARHNNQEVKIDGFMINIQKFKYAMYPHIECKVVSNLEEIGDVYFISPEHSGDPLAEYKKDSVATGITYSLDEIGNFFKDIKVNGVKKEIYLNEKKVLEQQLEQINNIIKEAEIEE